MDKLAVNYIKYALELIFLVSGVVIFYWLILDSKGHIPYSEIKLLHSCLEYLAASVCLALSFGLLIDLYLKKR